MDTSIEVQNVEKANIQIETSSIPTVFYLIGALILLFGIFGGYRMAQPFLGDFNWPLALTIWFSSIVSAMFFFGFGKIIELLIMIYNK